MRRGAQGEALLSIGQRGAEGPQVVRSLLVEGDAVARGYVLVSDLFLRKVGVFAIFLRVAIDGVLKTTMPAPRARSASPSLQTHQRTCKTARAASADVEKSFRYRCGFVRGADGSWCIGGRLGALSCSCRQDMLSTGRLTREIGGRPYEQA